MMFLAVYLNSGGGIVRHAETQGVMNMQLGELESKELAIDKACDHFNCTHVLNGVIVKGNHTGGFMIIDSQEFAEL